MKCVPGDAFTFCGDAGRLVSISVHTPTRTYVIEADTVTCNITVCVRVTCIKLLLPESGICSCIHIVQPPTVAVAVRACMAIRPVREPV